jgi:adapter protein MecA 1/2
MKQSETIHEKQEKNLATPFCVYSFYTLDEASAAASRLFGYFTGASALYKHNKRFYLVLHNNNPRDHIRNEDMETIMNEYGQKHYSSSISAYYLAERGEHLIKDNAIHILATYLS